MKLVYFDDYKLGVVKGDHVVDVSSVVREIPHTGPGDLINGVIARFDQYKGRLADAAASAQGVVSVMVTWMVTWRRFLLYRTCRSKAWSSCC